MKNCFYTAYLTIVYQVFHIENEELNGWFIKKRPIVMLLIAPIIVPFFMLYGIVLYFDWVRSWEYHWIVGKKKKLTWKQKLYIKKKLHNL
jgi:hypothetical protein